MDYFRPKICRESNFTFLEAILYLYATSFYMAECGY